MTPSGGMTRIRSRVEALRFLSAPWGSPVFVPHYATGEKLCQGVAKAKKALYDSRDKRGVRWRGLRGGREGPDPEPDLDHANVGK